MRFFTGILIILILLAGCSSNLSLEIVGSTADIMADRFGEIGITSGEKQSEFIKPISLSYDFILENTGKISY